MDVLSAWKKLPRPLYNLNLAERSVGIRAGVVLQFEYNIDPYLNNMTAVSCWTRVFQMSI